MEFFDALKSKRKVAFRKGELLESSFKTAINIRGMER